MKYVYQRRRWLYAGLAALLLLDAVLVAGWMHRPVTTPAADPAEVARLEQEVAARTAVVTRLRRARDYAPRLGPQLEQFAQEQLLGESGGYSRVAADLNGAAGEAGVRLGRLSFDTKADKERPDLIRVEIETTLAGGYRSLLRYLEALERSPRFYLVDGLRADRGQRGRPRLEIQLATYFRRATP